MRKAMCIGFVLLVAAGSAQAAFFDDFESYADQAAFQAAWPAYYAASNPSMLLLQGFGYDPAMSDPMPQSVNGVGSVSSQYRNGRNLDSFTLYSPGQRKVVWELKIAEPDDAFNAEGYPNAPSGGLQPRTFCELRAFVGDGATFPLPSQSLQGLVAMGLYNTPADWQNYHFRLYYGGVNAWFSTGIQRTPGWHTLTMELTSTEANVYVDGVLSTGGAVALTDPAKLYAFDAAILGGGLSSSNDAAFDNFSLTPEPMSLVLLGLGCLFIRRRR